MKRDKLHPEHKKKRLQKRGKGVGRVWIRMRKRLAKKLLR